MPYSLPPVGRKPALASWRAEAGVRGPAESSLKRLAERARI